MDGRIRTTLGLLLALVLLAGVPATASAQVRQYSPQEERWRHAAWVDDVYFAATNALVSGLATALVAAFHDDVSVPQAFAGGAAGGLVVFLGKRVSAARFSGAGLVGRQVGSVGASVGRNAGLGREPLDELVFPLGLARVYWDRASGDVRLRPDLNAIGWTARAALERRLELDWSHSLSAGTPVFLTRNATLDGGAAGRTLGDVIFADPHAAVPLQDILAHERVHVVQLDQHFTLWGEALERWAAGLLGDRSSRLAARMDFVVPTLGLGLGGVWAWGSNPMETEAYFLQMR